MKKELINLKKKCFKYKHDMPFIRNEISIESGDLSEQNAMGIYKRIDGKNGYDFTHKIIIEDRIINQYLYSKPNYYYGIGKYYFKNRIKRVILHELVHAFTEEYYNGWIDIAGVSNDASPIYLSVLYYLNGSSSHECVAAFKKSELYNKLTEFKTFHELDIYLTKLLLNYEKVANRHKNGVVIGTDFVVNRFIFGAYNSGLDKYIQTKQEFINKTKTDIKKIEVNLFQIGCCTMPEHLDDLVNKKRYGKFANYEYSKVAVLDNGTKLNTIYKTAVGL